MKAKVRIIANPKGAVKAFASVDLDGLIINDLKIIEGKNGLFVTLPTRAYEDAGETKYAQIVYVSDEDLFAKIRDAVLAVFNEETGDAEKKSTKNGRWSK